MSVSVLGVHHNYCAEIFNRFIMEVYHLISLRSFMNIPEVTRHLFNTFCEGEDRLFKILLTTVSDANMKIYLGFMLH
jgi:hypothetical protein